MTNKSLHPSEYSDHWESHLRSQVAAIGTLGLSIILAIAATQVEGHRLRTMLTGGALAGVLISRAAVANQVDKARILQDFTDVGDQARQQRLYKLMEPGARGAIESPENPTAFLRSLLDYPVIAIHGMQGSGKTTLAQWLSTAVESKQIVFDPHYLKGDWPGCTVIGAGADYDAIDKALSAALRLNHDRYQQRAEGVSEFAPVTYIVEELTSWEGKAPTAGDFIKASLSDFRKANQRLIKISHGTTNTAQGGAAGTAKMREEGEVKIHLLERGGGRAIVTLPFKDPVELQIPKLSPVTHGRAQPLPATAEPVDQHRATPDRAQLPERAQAIVEAIAREWSDKGKISSAFIKEDLGMPGRHYSTVRKLLDGWFEDETE